MYDYNVHIFRFSGESYNCAQEHARANRVHTQSICGHTHLYSHILINYTKPGQYSILK